jgi:hypothetical protein
MQVCAELYGESKNTVEVPRAMEEDEIHKL